MAISRIVRIKIGTETHELVAREGGCADCSLLHMCLWMNAQHGLCEALIRQHEELTFNKGKFKEVKK